MLRRAFPTLLAGAVLTLALACGTGESRRSDAALAPTFSSADAAVTAVLDALAAKDLAGLQALALSEQQFRAVVWPELPSSRPDVNLPFEYAWGTLHQNSRANLAMTVREHGGRRYRLQRVDPGQDSTKYRTFAVHRNVAVVVTDEDGKERRLHLFGSMLERGQGWKIFSYVVD